MGINVSSVFVVMNITFLENIFLIGFELPIKFTLDNTPILSIKAIIDNMQQNTVTYFYFYYNFLIVGPRGVVSCCYSKIFSFSLNVSLLLACSVLLV